MPRLISTQKLVLSILINTGYAEAKRLSLRNLQTKEIQSRCFFQEATTQFTALTHLYFPLLHNICRSERALSSIASPEESSELKTMGQLDTEQLVTDDNLTITSATSDQTQITVRCPIGNRKYSTLNLKKGPHKNNINITVCKDEDDYTRIFVEPDPNIERRNVKRKQKAKCLVALVSVVISILVCVAVFAAVQIILKAGHHGSSDNSKNNDSFHWIATNSTNVGNVTALPL